LPPLSRSCNLEIEENKAPIQINEALRWLPFAGAAGLPLASRRRRLHPPLH